MRLGGDRVINVDIRIIAASNKDIKSLIYEGKFRKDLFYRLNVLPLEIMPLRERREDIPELIGRIKKTLNVSFELSKDAEREFENHVWEGNVRELRNCIEYLAHLDKKIIEKQDVPFLKHEVQRTDEADTVVLSIANRVMYDENYTAAKFVFVMECLEACRKSRERIGRRRLAELAEKRDLFLSENEIRGILNTLKGYKLVSLSNGRGGTQITDMGVGVLKVLKSGKPG
jgi:transcriptional regulator with GAF, ATPase, and Fis domain